MIKIIKEEGFYAALYGLGLSFNLTSSISYDKFIELADKNDPLFTRLYNVSKRLYNKDLGHNKFLEHIDIWLLVDAPRYWWSEADTYRLSSKQSESTMHTLQKQKLTQDMFRYPINERYLEYLNCKIQDKNTTIEEIKNELPEGFLQKREWKITYNVLRNIIKQRYNHKILFWRVFCDEMLNQIEHPEYFYDLKLIMEGEENGRN